LRFIPRSGTRGTQMEVGPAKVASATLGEAMRSYWVKFKSRRLYDVRNEEVRSCVVYVFGFR
jgi:hypothetical protein